MITLQSDREYRGQDVFIDGVRVGWVSTGDDRLPPDERRPVTMMHKEAGTRYHKNFNEALRFIETLHNDFIG